MSIYGLGNVTASTATIAREVLAYLERNGTPLRPHPDTGVPVVWGKGTSSEHATGRALDFMVTADTSVGDVIADYVWEHRERLGLIHVIWRQRIRSTRVEPGVWRHMADRGSPTENHMDHPHALFDGRAVTQTPAATAPEEIDMDEIIKKLTDAIEASWSKPQNVPSEDKQRTRNQLLNYAYSRSGKASRDAAKALAVSRLAAQRAGVAVDEIRDVEAKIDALSEDA